MDPTGQFARRFPLVARTRPSCVPLARRVAELCERAREAARTGDLTEAAAVHNQATLIASDCGLPDLARQWCHQHVNIYLRARPLDVQIARLALEPITNLARLYIREGQGERAFALMDTLFTAVSSRTAADVDGIEIPADLTDTAETHKQIRSWLWAVLLATGARALASAGRWAEARARLDGYKGIGRRMLDGRQAAVIAHAVSGDTDSALALLADTTPGEPWENAVTACLTIQCHGASGSRRPDATFGPVSRPRHLYARFGGLPNAARFVLCGRCRRRRRRTRAPDRRRCDRLRHHYTRRIRRPRCTRPQRLPQTTHPRPNP